VQYLGRCRVKFTFLQSNPSYYYSNVRVSELPAFMGVFESKVLHVAIVSLLHVIRSAFLIIPNLMTLLVICGCWDISWLRHRSTNRKVAVSIPGGIIGIFH